MVVTVDSDIYYSVTDSPKPPGIAVSAGPARSATLWVWNRWANNTVIKNTDYLGLDN